MRATRTSSRKEQHVNVVLSKDVAFRSKEPGFDRWDFQHNALPELNLEDVDPSTTFLGKKLSLPLMISSMTGGYAGAERINAGLAEVCASTGIAMGVGSQRQALERKDFHASFSVVRKVAPNIPVVGNIGAAEVARLTDAARIAGLAELVRADAFAVHLNPLQELLQPEGTPAFRGVLAGIASLVKYLPVPVIVKEIGAGISGAVARRLIDVGVRIIDVAGAGGTSWAGVEIIRRNGRRQVESADFSQVFWDWGIPTVDALRQVCSLKSGTLSLTVIASGGMRNGLDVAKSIAFGADLAGTARPMLQTFKRSGVKGLVQLLQTWDQQIRGAMFLTGSKTIAELQTRQLVLK